MADFNGTKTREWKSGNNNETGTPAKGEYFNAEFDRLYSNDNALNGSKVNRSGDTIHGDLRVEGNFTVIGRSSTVQSDDVEVKDRLITLNKGESASGVTGDFSGIEVDRGLSSKFVFGFSESMSRFAAGFIGNLRKIIMEDDISVNAIANKIPIRNSEGKIVGDITGSATSVADGQYWKFLPLGVDVIHRQGCPDPVTLYGGGEWLNISSRALMYGISSTNTGARDASLGNNGFVSRSSIGQDDLFTHADFFIGSQITTGSFAGKYIREIFSLGGLFDRIEGGAAPNSAAAFGSGKILDAVQGFGVGASNREPFGSSSIYETVTVQGPGDTISIYRIDNLSVGVAVDNGYGTPRHGIETVPAHSVVQCYRLVAY